MARRVAALILTLLRVSEAFQGPASAGSFSRAMHLKSAVAEEEATGLRNIAIIAHVDHGKTTLVDAMLKGASKSSNHACGLASLQLGSLSIVPLHSSCLSSFSLLPPSSSRSHPSALPSLTARSHPSPSPPAHPPTHPHTDVYRENEEIAERVMDSNDQERERGITILAKNVAVTYKDTKINIVDTPGHADFGGEVERIMNMVDGVLLVVDSVEGPKPQTRFVLKKAIEQGIKPMLVVNKIDRPSARPEYVVDKTFDLFCELGASDDQTDFDICYASALNGMSGEEPEGLVENMSPLFDKILDLPSPPAPEADVTRQMLIANIDYDDFKGKLGIGRLTSGSLKVGEQVGFCQPGGDVKTGKVSELFVFDNLGRKSVPEVHAGEIVMVAGLADIQIGDTVVDKENPAPLPPIAVEEPTVRMTFSVNKSPMAGLDDKSSKLTSRVIRDRLMKELDRNVALRVEDDPDAADTYVVSGRGQLHLTVLIETMRREGFELMIGSPSVIMKTGEGGEKLEPFEEVECTVPDEYVGSIVDLLSKRKGELLDMAASTTGEGTTTIKYLLPTRGILGLRNAALTATRGTAVLDSVFHDYKPFAGELESRERGSLLAFEAGTVTPHGITGAQDRGQLFVPPKVEVYKDMIIGIHQRPGDLKVNVCKVKALTNMRSATKGITEGITPPIEMSLDAMVEYVQDDEVVEVTPSHMRMAKRPGWDKKAKNNRG